MTIQEIINNLRQISAECKRVTSGNISHKIINIEQSILNVAGYLEKDRFLGWHPGNEEPKLHKGKEEVELIVLFRHPAGGKLIPIRTFYNGKGWNIHSEIEYWCYLPKEA